MIRSDIFVRIGLLTILLASTSAGLAQSPVRLEAVEPSEPVVVLTARPEPKRSEVEQQARAISRMGDFYHDPLARFSDPICPGVLGLPADAAGIVVDRIRYDAERVGARATSSTDCTPNILVVFTRDAGAEVHRLLKTHGYLFEGLEPEDLRELQDEQGPVRAWNVTMLRNRHGQEQVPQLETTQLRIEGATLMAPMHIVTVPSSDSHVFLASRVDITASVVIVDLAAIDGMPVAQLADYAAMRALARTRPVADHSNAGTILSLFDPDSSHPRELTRFDLAYLTSLYEAGSNFPASVKIFGTSRAFEKIAMADADAAP